MSTTNQLGTALITGASTGIGATYADRLARRGYDLILVARNKPTLDKLAASLAAETGVRVQALPADLTAKADLDRVETVLRDDSSITLLVNNAGTATLAPFAKADIERLDQKIQLNIVAPTRLSRAALPGFLARNRGALVNISSVMSQMVQPGNSVYGATKAYLLHFSEVLALEVAASTVRVQANREKTPARFSAKPTDTRCASSRKSRSPISFASAPPTWVCTWGFMRARNSRPWPASAWR